MKNQIVKTTWFSLVAAALVAVPVTSPAQDTPAASTPPTTAPVPKKSRGVIHGKVTEVDSITMTFGVAGKTYNFTSESKVMKDNKPGIFADITVGETVSGSYKIADGGKLDAINIRVGEAPKKEKKKKADAPAAPETTPAPAPGN